VELGIHTCSVDRLDQESRIGDDGHFAAASPQCAETLVADGAAQIASLVDDIRRASRATDERRKHLLNDVRGARGISKQHQGVSIQPRSVPVVRAADPVGRWLLARPAPYHVIL